jgi:hypothetical protein
MNPTPDAIASGREGAMTPQQAAALLDQASNEARARLEPSPPWLLATRAVAVLAALGAIWLSVRGQHPYQGPTAADIPVLIAFVVVNFTATVAIRRRATAGVRGRTQLHPADIVVLVLAWGVVIVIVAALAAAGTNLGHYPTSVLIAPGVAWAAIGAARKVWRRFGVGLGVAAVGVAGVLAGPVGSWAVGGVGLCAVLLGAAAAVVWSHRS